MNDYSVPDGFMVVEFYEHTPAGPTPAWSVLDGNGCVIHVNPGTPTQAAVDAVTDEHAGKVALVFAALAASLGPIP